jgi:hypothetical protein
MRNGTGSHLELLDERQISEEEAGLFRAVEAMREQYHLSKTSMAMFEEIKRAIVPVLHILTVARHGDGKSFAESVTIKRNGDAVSLMEDTAAAILARFPDLSKRKAKQLAQFVWNNREKIKGRPPELDEHVVVHLLGVIEAITGQKFRYWRLKLDKGSRSGEPVGAMLDALLAALDWANATSLLGTGRRPPKAKAEAVLSLLKRVGRLKGRAQI